MIALLPSAPLTCLGTLLEVAGPLGLASSAYLQRRCRYTSYRFLHIADNGTPAIGFALLFESCFAHSHLLRSAGTSDLMDENGALATLDFVLDLGGLLVESPYLLF